MAVEARPHAGIEATVAEVGQTAIAATFEPIGPVIMKGIPDPIRLYRAVSSFQPA